MSTIFESGYAFIPISSEIAELSEESLNLARTLFELPRHTKEKYSPTSSIGYASGWRPTPNGGPEFWHVDGSDPEQAWPKALDIELITLTKLMTAAGNLLVAQLDELLVVNGLNSKGAFIDAVGNMATRARLVHYFPDERIRFPAHFDSGLITVFAAESAKGLEYRSGELWTDVGLERHWLVGCASTLAEIANCPALEHRVNASSEHRFAVALFFHADHGVFKTRT